MRNERFEIFKITVPNNILVPRAIFVNGLQIRKRQNFDGIRFFDFVRFARDYLEKFAFRKRDYILVFAASRIGIDYFDGAVLRKLEVVFQRLLAAESVSASSISRLKVLPKT